MAVSGFGNCGEIKINVMKLFLSHKLSRQRICGIGVYELLYFMLKCAVEISCVTDVLGNSG